MIVNKGMTMRTADLFAAAPGRPGETPDVPPPPITEPTPDPADEPPPLIEPDPAEPNPAPEPPPLVA